MKKILVIIFFALALTSTLYGSSSEEKYIPIIKSMIEKYGIDSYMEQLFEEENKHLPLRKDRFDTVTSIHYITATKTRMFTHILNKNWMDAINASAKKERVSFAFIKNILAEESQKNAINAACSVKLSRLYLKHGVKLMSVYSKQDGTFLFSTEVREKDCPK